MKGFVILGVVWVVLGASAACANYYETLGVEPSASAEEIKRAYRKLAAKVHPDRNKEPGAADTFKALGEAFDTLGDPQKRARYDSGLESGRGERPPASWDPAFSRSSSSSKPPPPRGWEYRAQMDALLLQIQTAMAKSSLLLFGVPALVTHFTSWKDVGLADLGVHLSSYLLFYATVSSAVHDHAERYGEAPQESGTVSGFVAGCGVAACSCAYYLLSGGH